MPQNEKIPAKTGRFFEEQVTDAGQAADARLKLAARPIAIPTACGDRAIGGERAMANYEFFEASDVVSQSGVVLPATRVALQTRGRFNAARDNAIVNPIHYVGTHDSSAWVIGPGIALDPEAYFIIVPNMLGNSLS